MSCCKKKVFKCQDMDGIGKIFVKKDTVISAEDPVRFKIGDKYYQETDFKQPFTIGIDLSKIKVDLSNFYTKKESDDKFAAISLLNSSYYNSQVIDNKFADHYTKTETDNKFATTNYLNSSFYPMEYIDTELRNFYTKGEADDKFALKSDTPIGTETFYDVTIKNDNNVADIGGLKVKCWSESGDILNLQLTFDVNNDGYVGKILYLSGRNDGSVNPTDTRTDQYFELTPQPILLDRKKTSFVDLYMFQSGKKFKIDGVIRITQTANAVANGFEFKGIVKRIN